ncbi:MAG TPA: PHP domain-containing protein, partial [Planctomycetota bacterium]|nr:PHP domain-containing protein [Planctomycetota bacterium]
ALRVRVASAAGGPTELLYATGAPGHLRDLQRLAEARGITLAPRGLTAMGSGPAPTASGKDEIPAGVAEVTTEAEVYARLGLPWIPPELREGAGEVEAAMAGTLPDDLLDIGDLRGAVHCHTVYSDGRHTVAEMARAAERLGMQYVTITDHSPSAHYAGGLSIDRLRAQWDEIARVQETVSVRLLRGTESDILADGALDYPDTMLEQLDVVIASVHQRHRMDPDQMTRRLVRAMEHPCFKVWGHALGRLLLSRPPFDCRVEEVLDAAARSRAAIEINGDPHRLDLPPRWVRAARDRGLRFVVSVDAHSTGELDNQRYGVAMARRGWVRRGEVLNALGAEAFAGAVAPSGNPRRP